MSTLYFVESKGGRVKCPYSMNETKMTLTERNQKLYDLRQQLDKKRMELAWIETEIMSVKSQYDRENIDLFEEMFGEKNTLWDHLDRMSDTPIAEEVYGG